MFLHRGQDVSPEFAAYGAGNVLCVVMPRAQVAGEKT